VKFTIRIAKVGHGKVEVTFVTEDGKAFYTEKAELLSEEGRQEAAARLAPALAKKLGRPVSAEYLEAELETAWLRHKDEEFKKSAEPAKPAAAAPAAEEPWGEPVNGVELLDSIVVLLKQYLVLPEWAAEVCALWVVHTYLADVADHTPYLLITSPVRECGKTTLLELLEQLAFRAESSGGITAAALYRLIDSNRPTMLLDELDTRLRGEGGEALRGVLNTGFHRNGKVTICVGDNHDAKNFSTYGPKVLAGIGKVWDTVLSRSVPINMRRATKEERRRLKKIRGDRIWGQLRPYRQKLLRYANDIREAISATEVNPPEQLSARQSDVWRPLLAIAAVAGGHWPKTAADAAVGSHKDTGDEGDNALLLLEDLKALFEAEQADALFSEKIVEYLVEQEVRPWPEYQHGKPITASGVAKLLKRFGVRSKNVRDPDEQRKGYKLEDLAPVFERYLSPPPPPEKPSQPSQESSSCSTEWGCGGTDDGTEGRPPADGDVSDGDGDDSCGGGGLPPGDSPSPPSSGTSPNGQTTSDESPEFGTAGTAFPEVGGGLFVDQDPAADRPETPSTPPSPPTYTLVTDSADLPMVIQAVQESSLVGLDIETTGLDPRADRVRLLQIAADNTDGGITVYMIDCFATDPSPVWEALSSVPVVAHNASFELSFLTRLGFVPGEVRDTMLMSQVCYAGDPCVQQGEKEQRGHSLLACCLRELGETIDKTQQKSNWSAVPLSVAQLGYAAADAVLARRLHDALAAKLDGAGQVTAALEHWALAAVT
jgi:hypothetical protein